MSEVIDGAGTSQIAAYAAQISRKRAIFIRTDRGQLNLRDSRVCAHEAKSGNTYFHHSVRGRLLRNSRKRVGKLSNLILRAS
jgi:hypothetical protein